MGNDYIAAYPPVCATSDRGDGKMRITWPARGLDRVLLAALTTSHYVANVSLGTPESAAILATGGTEGGGFYIDVDKTYAGSTWLNTHRYSPQRQATVYYYTTFNLARAAMFIANNHDNVFLWDKDITGTRMSFGTVATTATVIDMSCWGGRANQQNGLIANPSGTDFYRIEGNLTTFVACTWQNLSMLGMATYNRAVFWWYQTAGAPTGGGGITFSRIIYAGAGGYFFDDTTTTAAYTPFTFNQCVITGCIAAGIALARGHSNATTISHCTIGLCGTGITTSLLNQATYTNNLVFDCTTCYGGKSGGTYNKCAATDATGSEAGLNSLTRAQLAFYNDNDNGYFDAGPGILTTSVLYHAGADTTDTTDIKGNARHATTPSIGAYEGTVNAFGVSWPTAAQIADGITAQTFATLLTGTLAGVTYPNAPDITVARLTDTSARVTVDGDAGVTNYVLYATWADGGNTWLAWGNRSGDGTVDKTGLTSGQTYLICAYSQDATGGRAFSNIKVFTAGPATGTASGGYAKFIEKTRDTVLASASLAAAVTAGTLADHVKLGRALNVDTDTARHSNIIANGPVVYVQAGSGNWSPRAEQSDRGELVLSLLVCQAFDQSASADLITQLNFVDALRKELLTGADGTGGAGSWLSSVNAGNLRVAMEEPTNDGPRDELWTRLRLTVTDFEAL